MRTAQRAVRRSRTRRMVGRARGRVYVGSAVTRRESARIFFSHTTQHMASRALLADWLGGAFMVCGIVGWGALIVFLSS
jgi:hypothetical protein